MTKTTTKQAADADETASDIAAGALRASVVRIRDEIQEIADGTKKPKPRDPTVRIAQLAKIIAPIAAELRKAEKAELDAIRRITPGVVMQWIKLQTPEYRARLVREVQALDAKERKSVLG